MTKAEVMEFLQKSKRSVETYVSSGRLKAIYVHGSNGKMLSFGRADVEAFKQEMQQTWVPNTTLVPVATQSSNLGLVRVAPPVEVDQHELVATLTKLALALPSPKPAVKPWLTLSEAVDYSGLPASYLLQAARDGAIHALDVGSGKKEFWRFNRDALSK